MFRGIAQCKDPLCHFIYLKQQVVVQFFKLQVQFKEFIPLDIPVTAPGILVKDGVVCQQYIQFFCQLFALFLIESDRVHGCHFIFKINFSFRYFP